MSYEESYVKASPFDKMPDGTLDPQMIEDILPIISKAVGYSGLVLPTTEWVANAWLIA